MPAESSVGYVYNLRFRGQYFDVETGLHYNVNRDYEPATGRYRQVDPIGYRGRQWSLYAYASNDPSSYIDPTGRDAVLLVNPWGAYLGPLGFGSYGGHAGIAVGNDNTGWTFYSEGGLDDNGNQITTMKQYPGLSALEDALGNVYTAQEGEHTSPLQDEWMNDYARKHLQILTLPYPITAATMLQTCYEQVASTRRLIDLGRQFRETCPSVMGQTTLIVLIHWSLIALNKILILIPCRRGQLIQCHGRLVTLTHID